MTRFARAIGSKSSNARVKADPTPWSEMAPPKTNGKRNAASIEDDEVTAPKVETISPPKKLAKVVKLGNPKSTPKSKLKPKPAKKTDITSDQSGVELNKDTKESNQETPSLASDKPDETVAKPEKLGKKNKKKEKNAAIKNSLESAKPNPQIIEAMEITSDASNLNSQKAGKKNTKKKKTSGDDSGKSINIKDSTETPAEESSEKPLKDHYVDSNQAETKSPKPGKKNKKKQKKVANNKAEGPSDANETNIETEPSSVEKSEMTNEDNKEDESKPKKEKKKKNPSKAKLMGKNNASEGNISQKNPRNKWKNGQPEADNLKQNSDNRTDDVKNADGNQMNGWSAMKKKKVQCLRCRRMGHKANECRQERKGKLCYKCGDTQHTSRECAIKEEVYKFAECFICRQTGHLTRSCPNNTKGIYPHGGACFKCGENTHLAKDCPTLKKVEDDKENSKEEKQAQVFVGILDSKQSADADVSESVSATPRTKKGKKQVVKF